MVRPLQPLVRLSPLSSPLIPSSYQLRLPLSRHPRPRHPSLRLLTTSNRLQHRQFHHQHNSPAQDHEHPKKSNEDTAYTSSDQWPLPLKLLALATLIPITEYLVNKHLIHEHPEKNDAPPSTPPYPQNTTPLIVPPNAQTDNEDNPIEQIPTSNQKVPYFPRKIYVPTPPTTSTSTSPPSSLQGTNTSAALPAGVSPATSSEEYILLGLGVRKVSFLRIQVYVVGLYVAKSDLARLQEGMIHAVASPSASTLISSEKATLKQKLLDAKGSEEIWSRILSPHEDPRASNKGIRSALRIVSVRDTHMGHMRDGFIRMVEEGGRRERVGYEAAFRDSVQGFRAVMGRGGKVEKGKVLLLGRGGEGEMSVWVEQQTELPGGGKDDGKGGEMMHLGGVTDERIARSLWMGYLAGPSVATEEARASIVDGVLDLVERPIGTVETQVI